jgi:hypothetical protein
LAVLEDAAMPGPWDPQLSAIIEQLTALIETTKADCAILDAERTPGASGPRPEDADFMTCARCGLRVPVPLSAVAEGGVAFHESCRKALAQITEEEDTEPA